MTTTKQLLLVPVREFSLTAADAPRCSQCDDLAIMRLQFGSEQPDEPLCRWCALPAASQRASDYDTDMTIQQSIHDLADELESLAALVAYA